MTDDSDLHHRANELAIETFYWDNEGDRHEANPESLRKVVEVVEADYARSQGRRTHPVLLDTEPVHAGGVSDAQLRLADGESVELTIAGDEIVFPNDLPVGSHHLTIAGPGFEESAMVVVAPDRMPRSGALERTAAVFAPAYALWERDRPLPSFAHLAELNRALPALGASSLVTLPLSAGFLDEPYDASPYAPVSRLHWNEVYLDEDQAGLAPAEVPAIGDVIEWRTLARRRRRQLLETAAALGEHTTVAAASDQWAATHPDIADYARFRATVAPDPVDAGYPQATVEASHRLAQYLAHRQLGEIESAATDGPRTGALALDLPIGSHPKGYETWAERDLWAPAMSVGAPPDALFRDGQNWGFPPQLPGEAERSGFSLWRRLVARCGQYASILRIDHILGLHRLWWVPDGMSATDGVYVRYPRQALTSVIAAEAARCNTTLVGENLGTVPQEAIDLLADWHLLGMYAEQLQIHEGVGEIPADTFAGLRTHDMPPFAAMFADLPLAHYRSQLADRLGHPVPDTIDGVIDAALGRLARSDAYMVVADLDDLLGETRPHNVPGKVLAGTWSRRFDAPTSETLALAQVRHRLAILTDRKPL